MNQGMMFFIKFVGENWPAAFLISILFSSLVALISRDYFKLQTRLTSVEAMIGTIKENASSSNLSNVEKISKVKESIAEATIKINHLNLIVDEFGKNLKYFGSELLEMRDDMAKHRTVMSELVKQSNLLVKIITSRLDAYEK